MALPKKRHAPPHVYLDDAIYFLTARIADGRRVMKDDSRKGWFRDLLRKRYTELDYRIYAWVILDNHYHILFRSRSGADLPTICQRVHGGSSSEWNKQDGESRRNWPNYRDYCPRNEGDFWRHFNYIHHNPLKHGYVPDIRGWQFSSAAYYIREYGYEWLMSAFEQYPIIDFTPSYDEGKGAMRQDINCEHVEGAFRRT